MPTYDYRCAKCGEDLEVYQSFSEAPLTRHKACGGKLTKVLSPAGIVLKGSGFYKTDNRSSNGKHPGEKKDVATEHPDVVREMDAAYDKWWDEVLPLLENENAVGPPVPPFQEMYWKQFGGGPK